MKEIWKEIEESNGVYEISSKGRVRNKLTQLILTPSTKNNGYKEVGLKYGLNKYRLVHRLVAIAFIPNPENLKYVNHIDENKCNNSVENLEWCTCKYNINYGKGAFARNSPVIQKSIDNEVICIWGSMKEASKVLGIKYQGISRVCRKLRKTCGGFKWEYLNTREETENMQRKE